jgi:hypothetical protein
MKTSVTTGHLRGDPDISCEEAVPNASPTRNLNSGP